MSNTMSNVTSNSSSDSSSMPIPIVQKQVTSVTNNKPHLHVRHIEQSTYQICR